MVIMFTGIIKKTARIEATRKQGGNIVVSVRTPTGLRFSCGQSISVNGICSTISAIRGGTLVFQYVPETLRKTTVRWWKKGDSVNLEQSMKFGDPIDGHLVSGHVDGVGRLAATVQERGERLFKIETSKELIAHLVPKGSIALDGVSLTIADACPPLGRRVRDGWFSVALIPYTLAHTNLQFRTVGDRVNIETDILAKYATKSAGGSRNHSDILKNIRMRVLGKTKRK